MAVVLQEVESAAPGRAESCPECGEGLLGDFCHRCGEKRPEARDFSVRHFVRDTAQELTSLDSKLTRTLLALLFRPGRLTCEWVAGRRTRYLKPLNLCLGVFAVSLFVFTASKQVSMFDIGVILENERQTAEQWGMKGGGALGKLFDRTAARKGVTRQALQDAVSDRWQRNLSLTQPVQIILLAVLLQVVYFFSRRYFVEHLVFSMHFLSFTVLTTTLLWPVYYVIGITPTRLNMLVAVAKFAVDVLYLFVALRLFYRGSPAVAAVLALVVFAGYFVIYVVNYVAAMVAALTAVIR
ncbi:MAG TPA: DUF3667 domain-containing protein [Pyrinomonadaceae bacterium]